MATENISTLPMQLDGREIIGVCSATKTESGEVSLYVYLDDVVAFSIAAPIDTIRRVFAAAMIAAERAAR